MKIGILSDTHGHLQRTTQAIDLLASHNIDVVCHCGDLGSRAIVDALDQKFRPDEVPVHAVLGNVDHYNRAVTECCGDTGINMLGKSGTIELGDRRFALVHGDDRRKLAYVITSGDFDYVLTGHTHTREDRRESRTRIINPGAVYRSAEPSVAILDLITEVITFLELKP